MKTLLASVLLSFAAAHVLAANPAVDAAIANPERSAADRERDARDKPAELLTFAGVKPGMTVADVFGAGGYYAELLAGVVGNNGKVLLINNLPYASFAKDDLKARFTPGRLPNVERRLVEASHLNVAPKSVDLAVFVMSYHDVYWVDEKEGWPAISVEGFFSSLKSMLKPGGRVLIVDHQGPKGSANTVSGKLHRIEEDFTKKDFAAHGFVLDKTWDGLRHPDDQLDKMVFDDAVKGKTDRFVHLYRLK